MLCNAYLVPTIKGNKRNIKDGQKLKELEFTRYEQNIYDKRFIIESTNSHIKSFKLVQTRMECKSINFEGSLFIVYMNKVLKHRLHTLVIFILFLLQKIKEI
jgi:hypothetical protein